MTTRAISAPGNFRAYAAGTGVSGALLAGALVAFLSVAAFVGFKGLPVGGSASTSGSVTLQPAGPTAAATAAAAPGAVAAAPVAPRTGAAGTPAGGATATGGGSPNTTPQQPGTTPADGGLGPAGSGDTGTLPPAGIPSPAANPGALGGTVDRLDDTTGRLGIRTNLGGLTDRVTSQLDGTVNNLLNQVGGAVNNPHLGDNLSGTVNNLTCQLLCH